MIQGLNAHLPCGIQPDVTTLEIAPHIGWASVAPDAAGSVNITIQGMNLAFQGPAYHDKVRMCVFNFRQLTIYPLVNTRPELTTHDRTGPTSHSWTPSKAGTGATAV